LSPPILAAFVVEHTPKPGLSAIGK
jgi:hypothetical protein